MRLLSFTILIAVLPLVCTAQSIQPFYQPGDVVFKPELVGKWDLDGVPLEFRDIGNETYGINLFGDNGLVIHFRVHLVLIGRNYFLDGQVAGIEIPGEEVTTENNKTATLQKPFELDEQDVFLNRHHGLILVEFAENTDQFVAHVWDDRWLPQNAAKKGLPCSYLKDELGRILLTGESSCLRAIVEGLPRDAFDTGYTLTRLKEGTGAPISKNQRLTSPVGFGTIRPRRPENSIFSAVAPETRQQGSEEKRKNEYVVRRLASNRSVAGRCCNLANPNSPPQ